MEGDSDYERQSRHKNRDNLVPIQNPQNAKHQSRPAGADRTPSSPRPLYSGAPQSIHEPQVHGYIATPPNPNEYGASPFPPTQSSHYYDYPTKTTSSYTEKPEARVHPLSGSTDRFDGGYGQRGSRPKEGVSNSSDPVPSQRGISAASRFATLEDEYAALYRERHEIGVRMEDIKRRLPAERYTALMAKLDPQELATLKPWSDNNGN